MSDARSEGPDDHGENRQRLVVVSNRLPLVFQRGGEGQWEAIPSSGGLVSALVPVLRNRGGTWLGWPGTTEIGADLEQTLQSASDKSGYALCPVHLDQQEIHDFYNGFSNEIIWPLFHDLQSLCNFQPRYWRTYCDVNRKFAQAIIDDQKGAGDFIWVHDYHLMNVAHELRAKGCESRLGFFLHIPFPPVDLFVKLPWRAELILALLEFDLLGFQTLRDRRNFVQCARALVRDLKVHGKGQVITASSGGRETRIGAFPIGIDYNFYVREATAPRVAERARELHQLLPDRSLVLGVDRLDYTKGVPLRLQAFETLMHRHPQLRGKLSLIQVIVPSRVDIPSYAELKTTIEQMVGRINGEYMRPGAWVPVWYVYGSLTRTELLAHYRAADIALITPLKDGMNLVAKEYCAASIEEDCVLILSEFAGSAAQLRRGALLVNPYDIEGVADALLRAHEMKADERRARMRRLRRSVRESDVYRWVDSFMNAAFTRHLDDFPLPAVQVAGQDEEYLSF